jgi:hypothetical protein
MKRCALTGENQTIPVCVTDADHHRQSSSTSQLIFFQSRARMNDYECALFGLELDGKKANIWVWKSVLCLIDLSLKRFVS